MKTYVRIGIAALVVGIAATLPSQAHERIRFGEGGNGIAGEVVSGAIGSNNEPAFEDEINGFDFILSYKDGSKDGNVISARGGDMVEFKEVKFLFLEEDQLDAEVVNEKVMPTPREVFRQDGRYQNKVRYVDDGAIGYVVSACFQDLKEQQDGDVLGAAYVPMSEPICIDKMKWVCGHGSQDPRNNEDDPEFDGRFHQFGCVADAEPFGAVEQDQKDRRKDKDSDNFSLPAPVEE